MLNKAPIFVNGFQRGGTTILMNLVTSHPGVQILSSEVHQVFYGRESEPVRKWARRFFYAAPLVVTARRHILWPYRLYERRLLPYPMRRFIDLLFYVHKVMAADECFPDHAGVTPLRLRARARLVAKCVNGVVLATPIFAHMYPDATFIALVRNGLALCEGFVRRGWSAERIGRMYQTVCERMLADAAGLPNYFIVRFEDILQDPVATTRKIYEYVGLDIDECRKFKLEARKSMSRNGRRSLTFGQERELLWYDLDDIGNGLRRDVNENQIARLSESDREVFLQQARSSMSHLGYI